METAGLLSTAVLLGVTRGIHIPWVTMSITWVTMGVAGVAIVVPCIPLGIRGVTMGSITAVSMGITKCKT